MVHKRCHWLIVAFVSSSLLACSGAPPIRPAAPGDLAMLGESEDGHFLPPERPFVPAALRQRLRVRRPAGPARPRLARNRQRVTRHGAGANDYRRRRSPAKGLRAPNRVSARRHAGSSKGHSARRKATSGTRHKPARRTISSPPRQTSTLQAEQRVEAAASLLGTQGLRRRAFVDHVLHASGDAVRVDARDSYPRALWQALRAHRTQSPRRGDVVFFRNTLDLNRNGRPDDGVTWVAIVERVESKRVLFIGQRAGKVRRMSLSARRPLLVRGDGGEVRNTRLVRWPGERSARTAGQCLAGYARP